MHFRLKTKTKTKSKIAAKINTAPTLLQLNQSPNITLKTHNRTHTHTHKHTHTHIHGTCIISIILGCRGSAVFDVSACSESRLPNHWRDLLNETALSVQFLMTLIQ